jgi:hypothetical protein
MTTSRLIGVPVPSSALELELFEEDETRQATIYLARGVKQRVRVLDAAGSPLSGATVVESAGGRVVSITRAGNDGETVIPVPAGETRTLFAIGSAGSFAAATMAAPRSIAQTPEPIVVVVPLPVATIHLVTRSTTGQAVPNVRFLLRYNGELLPQEAVQLLDRIQGIRLATDQSGRGRVMPAGLYELWPYGPRTEGEALRQDLGRAAPVQVEVKPGENTATLTFAAAQRAP